MTNNNTTTNTATAATNTTTTATTTCAQTHPHRVLCGEWIQVAALNCHTCPPQTHTELGLHTAEDRLVSVTAGVVVVVILVVGALVVVTQSLGSILRRTGVYL